MTADDCYELLVLGKNGEPQPYKPLQVFFNHLYTGSHSINFTTDKEGKLYFGKLKQILSLSIGHERRWELPSLNLDNWTYPDTIDNVVGGEVEIPIAQLWSEELDDLDRRLLTLVRSSHCGVIEDAYDQIKLIKKTNISSHYYLLNISNLKDGTYDLYLRGQRSHHITIKVHKGEYL